MMDLNVLKICSSLKWGQNWNQPGDWHILTKEAFWTYLDPSWLPLLQSSCCTRTHKSRLVMGFQWRVSLDTIPGYDQCCRGQHEVSSAEIKHVIVSWKSAICFPNALRKRNYSKATEKKICRLFPGIINYTFLTVAREHTGDIHCSHLGGSRDTNQSSHFTRVWLNKVHIINSASV